MTQNRLPWETTHHPPLMINSLMQWMLMNWSPQLCLMINALCMLHPVDSTCPLVTSVVFSHQPTDGHLQALALVPQCDM